jgi:hypothetical protein
MTTKKKVDWRIVVIAMICMTATEITALILGHNGTMLKIFLVIMSITAGSTIPFDKILKGGK